MYQGPANVDSLSLQHHALLDESNNSDTLFTTFNTGFDHLSLSEVCAISGARISQFLDNPIAKSHTITDIPPGRLDGLKQQIQTSLHVLTDSLNEFGLSNLRLAFNGGKDCLVLLVLFLCAIDRWKSSNTNHTSTPPLTSLPCVYVRPDNPFPEVESFVQSACQRYHLNLKVYTGPMKQAFSCYIHENSSIKAVLIGTRNADPHAKNLSYINPTDNGWPNFSRINPILHWHYSDIWTFIRYFRIPYCQLYDNGYSSLGDVKNTRPNPLLQTPTSQNSPPSKRVNYLPAYVLTDDCDERLGRE